MNSGLRTDEAEVAAVFECWISRWI